MRIARESFILMVICLVDLGTTLWFVGKQQAMELNPVMRFYLDLGYTPFITAKCLLFLGPLAVLEWARRTRPQFVHAMLRCTIVLYLGFYGTVVWHANRQAQAEGMTPQQIARVIAWSEQPVSSIELSQARGMTRPGLSSVPR